MQASFNIIKINKVGTDILVSTFLRVILKRLKPL